VIPNTKPPHDMFCTCSACDPFPDAGEETLEEFERRIEAEDKADEFWRDHEEYTEDHDDQESEDE
jgi:hypothetical protein